MASAYQAYRPLSSSNDDLPHSSHLPRGRTSHLLTPQHSYSPYPTISKVRATERRSPSRPSRFGVPELEPDLQRHQSSRSDVSQAHSLLSASSVYSREPYNEPSASTSQQHLNTVAEERDRSRDNSVNSGRADSATAPGVRPSTSEIAPEGYRTPSPGRDNPSWPLPDAPLLSRDHNTPSPSPPVSPPQMPGTWTPRASSSRTLVYTNDPNCTRPGISYNRPTLTWPSIARQIIRGMIVIASCATFGLVAHSMSTYTSAQNPSDTSYRNPTASTDTSNIDFNADLVPSYLLIAGSFLSFVLGIISLGLSLRHQIIKRVGCRNIYQMVVSGILIGLWGTGAALWFLANGAKGKGLSSWGCSQKSSKADGINYGGICTEQVSSSFFALFKGID